MNQTDAQLTVKLKRTQRKKTIKPILFPPEIEREKEECLSSQPPHQTRRNHIPVVVRSVTMRSGEVKDWHYGGMIYILPFTKTLFLYPPSHSVLVFSLFH
jgi:hypothetical protein